MNLTAEAESLDELYSVIDETIQLVLVDILRDNELDRFLRDRGWRAVNLPTAPNPGEQVDFDVPWDLIAEGSRGSERRAH